MTGQPIVIPPAGHVAGIYARSDIERVVFDALTEGTSMPNLADTFEALASAYRSAHERYLADVRSMWDEIELIPQKFNQLDRGRVRVAEKVGGEWRVNAWVKEAILLYFALRPLVSLVGARVETSCSQDVDIKDATVLDYHTGLF